MTLLNAQLQFLVSLLNVPYDLESQIPMVAYFSSLPQLMSKYRSLQMRPFAVASFSVQNRSDTGNICSCHR